MILIVIDMQEGLLDPQYGHRCNPGFESVVATLISHFRGAHHVLFTRHASRRSASPIAPDQPGFEIMAEVAPAPGEPVFDKTANSVLKNREFSDFLSRHSGTPLFFVGLATDICVAASAREANDLGYPVAVIADACATFDRFDVDGEVLPAGVMHATALASLRVSGIRTPTSNEVLANL